MRFTPLLVLAALALPVAVPAQTTIGLSLGAERDSKLIGDRVNPFDELYGINITQATAPTITLSLSGHLYHKYRYRFEGRVSSRILTYHSEDSDEKHKFTDLRTLAIVGMVEGEAVENIHWQVGFGPLIYLPKDKIGFFQDGGPIRAMITIGAMKKIPLGASFTITASARYDYHQFITKTLKERGFSQYQAVHHAGLSLGLERGF